MEIKQAINSLSALAQETRLAIFRLLVVTGHEGLTVGAIAEALNIANATLSFHLKALTSAELVIAKPDGRSVMVTANFDAMNALIDYLTENCCGGQSRTPTKTVGATKRSSATSKVLPKPIKTKR